MSTFMTRLKMILIMMTVISGILIARLLSFQFRLDPNIQEQLYNIAGATAGREVEYRPNRGQIYDRDGQVLAVNTLEYRVAISPAAIGPGSEPKWEVAKDLARLLDLDERETYLKLLPDPDTGYEGYVFLQAPVSLEVGAELEKLDIPGLIIEPIYRREYPQESLTTQVVGFVSYDSIGYWGVEEHYQAELAGQIKIATESGLPLDVSEDVNIRDGQDLFLTIDRDAQWIAEQVLEDYINQERAENGELSTIRGGTILVMNPQTGEILAMVSYPTYTSAEYNELPNEDKPRFTPSIQQIYEPGSIFKVITASVALDIQEPGFDLAWSYNNQGCEDMQGGVICDAGSRPGAALARGNITFAQCLILSLNTCTAHWNLIIGPNRWYTYLERFGFGVATGIDLAGEENGTIHIPGTATWGPFNFVQTSFGQGLSATALQMLTAANAIANDGVMMQPFIVRQSFDGEQLRTHRPTAIGRPISASTAQQVLQIMEQAVEAGEGVRSAASVEGYRVAGKTGTAQKIAPGGGYSDSLSWASFLGFIPADDPQLSILITLDQPLGYWGSQTAAPLFAELASRLVVLFELPPDSIRTELLINGANPFGRN